MKVIPRREHIPVGRENAITRAELATLWGMSDRDVRETIATMRTRPTDDRYAILSSSHNPPDTGAATARRSLSAMCENSRRGPATFLKTRQTPGG